RIQSGKVKLSGVLQAPNPEDLARDAEGNVVELSIEERKRWFLEQIDQVKKLYHANRQLSEELITKPFISSVERRKMREQIRSNRSEMFALMKNVSLTKKHTDKVVAKFKSLITRIDKADSELYNLQRLSKISFDDARKTSRALRNGEDAGRERIARA